MQSLYKQSFTSINKISQQIDKLSSIMNKEQMFTNQLQSFLKRQDEKSNQSSLVQNLDEYFKEYDNPTTKSLAIDENNNTNSQMQQQDTQIINHMYRNYLAEESQEEDKENLHDDKSTVIINNKNMHIKDKPIEHKSHINYYTTVNQDNRSLKKETQSKGRKSIAKHPTSSMPSEIIASDQKNTVYQKNNSGMFKNPVKIQSIDHMKLKKNNQTEHQPNFIKELKGKLSKVNKIEKEELNRLQQKKSHRKTELSSNRKTRRELGSAKSTAALGHTQKTSLTILHLPANTKSNSSCKVSDSKKKDSLKKHQQKGPSAHQWQRNPDRTGKKLNRVNICKLQENMKKNNQKKPRFKEAGLKKSQKAKNKKQSQERRQLKLHFTQSDQTLMKKLIDQKQLNREYARQTDKYLQVTKKMQKNYLQMLIQQCRQTSQQAIFKIKLVTLILYFFDQFASSSLITNIKIDTISQDFFTKIPQEPIINVLTHPKKILRLMIDLPDILMNNNLISWERVQLFTRKFQEINDQLDQQLQFFLIKKTILFTYVHSLLQYMNFLLQKELVSSTKRIKVVPTEQQKKLQGYYSSRSKRDQISKKYIKVKEKPHKFGFRCDSDRKITNEDEQIFIKERLNHNQSKTNPLKKIFK